ncbi:MAG: class I adenylate-forming enzyme family protein [Kineosporiaceae bacterium]
MLTPDQAWDGAARVAGALAALGAEPGDRVAFVATPCEDLVVAALGASASGVVPVVLNPGLLPHERDVLVRDAEPIMVIGDGELPGLLAGAPIELADVPLVRPMHYTSGTSGRAKGVYGGVLDHDAAWAAVLDEREVWDFGPDDAYLAAGPLYHSAPLRFALGTLLAGGTVRVLPHWSVEGFLDGLAVGVTTTFIAPTPLQRLLNAVVHDGIPFDTKGFRLLAHAGAPCPHPVKERAIELFPAGSVWEFYGSTEGQFTACPAAEWQGRPGTVGRARPHREIRVDADDVIWCRPPVHARFTYWRNEIATTAAWSPDGEWFTVGDLGYLDDDGYLFIESRREDLIITGGVNVYPVEIEQALSRTPGVRELAVFGVPDADWGQRVCVAVVGDVQPGDVHAFAATALAGYKRPKSVYVVDDLPTSANGKIVRRQLAERYSS